MSDLDVIDQRLRRVERHLGFKAAGTQAGHSHHPATDHGVEAMGDAMDDDETVGRVEALEIAVTNLQQSVERLEKLLATDHGHGHGNAPATS